MIPIPRKLLKRTLIKSQKRRTIQNSQHRINRPIQNIQKRCQVRQDATEHARNHLLSSLEEETAEIVSLEEGLSVVDSAGDVAGIDADEGVGCAGVAAELDDFGVFDCEDGYVGLSL
jgi:hypothetical protein